MTADNQSRIGCVVVSIRNHKETLVLQTSDGEVIVEVSPITNVRSKVIVRAPQRIGVSRRKRGEE